MTEEELQDITKPKKFDWRLLLICVLLIAAWIAYNTFVYDDWKCAFSRCVKASMVK